MSVGNEFLSALQELINDERARQKQAEMALPDAARKQVFEVGVSLDEMERRMVIATLAYYSGNKARAADTLGVSLKTLYNKLSQYGVPK